MGLSATSRIKALAMLLCLVFALAFCMPANAQAQDSHETVRVGWYDSSFNTVDQFGRRSGYAYEYQMKNICLYRLEVRIRFGQLV